MKNVLALKQVTKRYKDFTLDSVDLTVPGGTIMGLIGENGAGKSTLIKCILGIVRPESGEITILGTDPETAKADIGVVMDESLFHDQLRPRQVNGIMAGLYPSWDRDLFYGYLDKFQLPESKQLKEFSRGMKMKLAIAAALAHRPRLLLLDEATGGLDPVVRDEIVEEFMAFVSDEDHGILISSHITSDLEKACDAITYLHKGRVTLSGEKDALLSTYGRIACTKAQLAAMDPSLILGSRASQFAAEAVVNDRRAFRQAYPDIPVDPVSLEDLMVFTVRRDEK